MNAPAAFALSVVIISTISCASKKEPNSDVQAQREQDLRMLTKKLDDAESNSNLRECVDLYTENAIIMPEYQVTLSGRNELENYYDKISRKQHIKSIRRLAREFIHLKNTIVVIGTFKREYIQPAVDSLISLQGKYWHIWILQDDGTYRIKGEAFGYFRPVDDTESLVVSTSQKQPGESEIQTAAPLELKAYNALMEKGVLQRNGALRAEFFTDDGVFYPFADTTVVGKAQLTRYLIAYSRRGIVTIDSVSCYTYAFENHHEYVLEYAMFKVKWHRPDGPGKTEGKGIRVWKRQQDKSLKLFRQIGTHNYL